MSNIITQDIAPVTLAQTTAANFNGINLDKAAREGSASWKVLGSDVQALIRSLAPITDVQAADDALAASIKTVSDGLAGKVSQASLDTAVTNLSGALSNKVDTTDFSSFTGAQQTINSDVNSAIAGKADKSAVTAIDGRVTALETALGADEATLTSAQSLIVTLQDADVTTLAAIGTLETAVAALAAGGGTLVESVLMQSAMGATTDYVLASAQTGVDTSKNYTVFIDGVQVKSSRITWSAGVFDFSGIPANNRPDESSEVWVKGYSAA